MQPVFGAPVSRCTKVLKRKAQALHRLNESHGRQARTDAGERNRGLTMATNATRTQQTAPGSKSLAALAQDTGARHMDPSHSSGSARGSLREASGLRPAVR